MLDAEGRGGADVQEDQREYTLKAQFPGERSQACF